MNDNSAKIYSFLMTVFVVMLVLTNIIGTKIFVLFEQSLPTGLFGFPLAFTAGIITYPITFLVTDITSEIFGKKKANLLVLCGFFCSLLSLLIITIVINLTPSEAWLSGSPYDSIDKMDEAFNSVFALPGILITASMTAYLIAQLIDIRIFHLIKNLTGTKLLWLRNNLSTMCSQLVDTIIVNSIFLGIAMKLDINIIIQIIICNYIIKIIFAAVDTPLVYICVYFIRKKINKVYKLN